MSCIITRCGRFAISSKMTPSTHSAKLKPWASHEDKNPFCIGKCVVEIEQQQIRRECCWRRKPVVGYVLQPGDGVERPVFLNAEAHDPSCAKTEDGWATFVKRPVELRASRPGSRITSDGIP